MNTLKIFVWDNERMITIFEINNCLELHNNISPMWFDNDCIKTHIDINKETFEIENFWRPSETYCMITVKKLECEVKN